MQRKGFIGDKGITKGARKEEKHSPKVIGGEPVQDPRESGHEGGQAGREERKTEPQLKYGKDDDDGQVCGMMRG